MSRLWAINLLYRQSKLHSRDKINHLKSEWERIVDSACGLHISQDIDKWGVDLSSFTHYFKWPVKENLEFFIVLKIPTINTIIPFTEIVWFVLWYSCVFSPLHD